MVINSEEAQSASPILLDIEGLGIRSIEQVVTDAKVHHIIAAEQPTEKTGLDFMVGPDTMPLYKNCLWTCRMNLHPRQCFSFPGTETIWILSDDGTIEKTVSCEQECLPGELLKNGKCPNKFLVDPGRRTFRAIQMHPDKNQ